MIPSGCVNVLRHEYFSIDSFLWLQVKRLAYILRLHFIWFVSVRRSLSLRTVTGRNAIWNVLFCLRFAYFSLHFRRFIKCVTVSILIEGVFSLWNSIDYTFKCSEFGEFGQLTCCYLFFMNLLRVTKVVFSEFFISLSKFSIEYFAYFTDTIRNAHKLFIITNCRMYFYFLKENSFRVIWNRLSIWQVTS